MFITTTTTVLALLVNSMAGFAIAVPRWKGKSIVLSVIIAMIVPFETMAIPLLIVSKLPWISFDCENSAFVCLTTNWLDTYHVQIIPFIVGAFYHLFIRPVF
ncbi:MAG: hypothetical protein R3D55_28820 [Chloroflexota bacterium]